jgi:serine/threonine protein kinase
MESDERKQRAALDKLERVEFELTEQDTLILEQVKRSPNSAVPASQRALLRKLFREVEALDLGYTLPSVDSDDPDSLRPEIRSARAKVVWEKKRLSAEISEAVRPIQDAASGPRRPSLANIAESFRTALNEYEKVRMLGEGGSGIVYQVRDVEGREYALKLLRKELLGGNKQRRFQRELSFCKGVSHPNVIAVLDYGLFGTQDIPFFVMPLYESTLRRTMQGPIDVNRVPWILQQLVMGLEFAHGEGIAHRDLKPENILCSPDLDTCVIADFGIAHFNSDALLIAVETDNQERLANFAYAAPEQRIRGGAAGTAADVWALGLIINELFTEQIPLGREHRSIASVAPQYAYLDRIVDEMLRQAPQDRPTISVLKSRLFPDHAEAIAATQAASAPAGGPGKEAQAVLGPAETFMAAKVSNAPRKTVLAFEPPEFSNQQKTLPDTEVQKEICRRPRWRVWIHPVDFKRARFRTPQDCKEFMLSSYVKIKGWLPYPWFSPDALEVEDERVVGEIDRTDGTRRHMERWALFRSGQFVHDRAFDEIAELGDHIHVLEIVDTVTGAFELAARLAQRGVLVPKAQLKFELYGVSARRLTWPLDVFGKVDAIKDEVWAQEDNFSVIKEETSADLETHRRELALQTAIEIFADFGWSNPPIDKLAQEQQERFGIAS